MEEAYLSVFDKADGKRITSYTIMGEIHGKTMDELKEKAAKEYPDAYAVPQTREDWRRTVSGDLRWNGEELVDPPEPTAEEKPHSRPRKRRQNSMRSPHAPPVCCLRARPSRRCRQSTRQRSPPCPMPLPSRCPIISRGGTVRATTMPWATASPIRALFTNACRPTPRRRHGRRPMRRASGQRCLPPRPENRCRGNSPTRPIRT